MMPLSTTLESHPGEFEDDDWGGEEELDPDGDELELDDLDDIDEDEDEEEEEI